MGPFHAFSILPLTPTAVSRADCFGGERLRLSPDGPCRTSTGEDGSNGEINSDSRMGHTSGFKASEESLYCPRRCYDTSHWGAVCVCVCALTRGSVAMVTGSSSIRYLRMLQVSEQINSLCLSFLFSLFFFLSLFFSLSFFLCLFFLSFFFFVFSCLCPSIFLSFGFSFSLLLFHLSACLCLSVFCLPVDFSLLYLLSFSRFFFLFVLYSLFLLSLCFSPSSCFFFIFFVSSHLFVRSCTKRNIRNTGFSFVLLFLSVF